MAKKKQHRRRSGPGRAGAGIATAASGGNKVPAGTRSTSGSKGAEPAPTVKPEPASPGGPNRLERKEAARLARERLRRKMARRRLYRRGLILLVIGGLIAGGVLLATRPKGAALNASEKQLLAAASQARVAAGCGAVQTTKPYPGPAEYDRDHIQPGATFATMPALSTYPSVPPASGPHNPTPLPAGVYPDAPPIDHAIHSLEHGAVEIWYAPAAQSNPAQAAELAKMQTFFASSREQTKVILAPYNYPGQGAAGQLPTGKLMALVAWHHVELCDRLSEAVAYDFVVHYRPPAPKGYRYEGDAPEPTTPI